MWLDIERSYLNIYEQEFSLTLSLMAKVLRAC